MPALHQSAVTLHDQGEAQVVRLDDVPVLIGDVRSGGQVEQDERVAKTIGDNGHSPDRNQTSPAMTRPPLPTIAATACETELTSQFASQWL